MKTYLLKPMVVVCLCLLTASFTFAADNYKMVKVKLLSLCNLLKYLSIRTKTF